MKSRSALLSGAERGGAGAGRSCIGSLLGGPWPRSEVIWGRYTCWKNHWILFSFKKKKKKKKIPTLVITKLWDTRRGTGVTGEPWVEDVKGRPSPYPVRREASQKHLECVGKGPAAPGPAHLGVCGQLPAGPPCGLVRLEGSFPQTADEGAHPLAFFLPPAFLLVSLPRLPGRGSVSRGGQEARVWGVKVTPGAACLGATEVLHQHVTCFP